MIIYSEYHSFKLINIYSVKLLINPFKYLNVDRIISNSVKLINIIIILFYNRDRIFKYIYL